MELIIKAKVLAQRVYSGLNPKPDYMGEATYLKGLCEIVENSKKVDALFQKLPEDFRKQCEKDFNFFTSVDLRRMAVFAFTQGQINAIKKVQEIQEAAEIAAKTLTHTEIRSVKEIKIDEPTVVFFESGEY